MVLANQISEFEQYHSKIEHSKSEHQNLWYWEGIQFSEFGFRAPTDRSVLQVMAWIIGYPQFLFFET